MTIRVLVVDDQAMVRAGFRLLLADEPDIEVVAEASNGLEAVAEAAGSTRRRPDGHPDARARRPRGDPADPGGRPRRAVLILTTFDLDEYVYEALRAGASGFVLKDDPPEQLIAAVRTVAGGDALLSPAVTRRVIRQFTRLRRQQPPPAVGDLTARELDVFRLITQGLSNAEIGRELFISDTTVKTHVTHILRSSALRATRVQVVVVAYGSGCSWTRVAVLSLP